MKFIQKIYYNNKPLIVTDNREALQKMHLEYAELRPVTIHQPNDYTHALDQLNNADVSGIILQEPSADALMKHLSETFKVIQAGGGVVRNKEGGLLLIFRRGKWDLPKGKLDEGETIEQCAVREVEEETGVGSLSLGKKATDTYHLYAEKTKNYLKHTTWFHMTTSGAGTLQPQALEDILDARWVAPQELLPYMSNTYGAIKDVLHASGMSWD